MVNKLNNNKDIQPIKVASYHPEPHEVSRAHVVAKKILALGDVGVTHKSFSELNASLKVLKDVKVEQLAPSTRNSVETLLTSLVGKKMFCDRPSFFPRVSAIFSKM